jgi:ribonuclease Z
MRELVVLGTASQAPTRTRHHNGYFLRWDRDGYLFDPGEGTQRQMLLAGIPASAVTRICLTHLHGDHCLGLPGVLQRISLDQVAHPVHLHYPASGARFVQRLRYASSYLERGEIVEHAHAEPGEVAPGLSVARLEHPVEAFGYRLSEPDGVRMLPDELARHGITGPRVREIQARGVLDGVSLASVSVPRKGQVVAFVMDTRLCDGVFALADRADMLVIESTFLQADAALAHTYGHLTAREAASVAAACGVRTLVLTHFSQRYTDPTAFEREAREVFAGELHIAEDLMRIPVPARQAA